MATEMEELIEFLSSPSPPVKKAAVDIVTGLTGSEDGLESLSKYAETLLPSLARLLDQSKEVSEPAGQALVNLSQDLDLAVKMVAIRMVKTLMDLLYKPESPIANLLVMLLVNLTQSDAGIADLLQHAYGHILSVPAHRTVSCMEEQSNDLECCKCKGEPELFRFLRSISYYHSNYALLNSIQEGDEKLSGLYIMKLVRSFCKSSSDSSEDPFEHVGSILVNISKNEAGRKILMDPRRGLLKQIIRQFDSSSPLRKKGVSGTIRNCCFQAENQLQNLLLISEFLWPALLLPVAGNKVYLEQDTAKMPLELGTALSIERESVADPEIRVQALESIYLITLQEAGRRALWSVNGPRILQVGYEDEEDPKVMEAYERVGALLVHGNEEGEALVDAAK